ncbi:MAG TPA: hypothetical protein VGI39_26970, partial [Polyangiaceae bacterium]
APLACPIFAVEGGAEGAVRVGAAASAIACARSKWYLGGSDDAVLVPAALMDAPVEPKVGLDDPYRDANARQRTLDAVKRKKLASLDGTVAKSAGGWRIELAVRDSDGSEIAHAPAIEDAFLTRGLRRASALLWTEAPLSPRPLDPAVRAWTGLPDIEAGLTWLDLSQEAQREACDTIRRRGGSLGLAYPYLAIFCPGLEALRDAGTVVLDESSPAALVTTFNAMPPEPGISEGDAPRVADEAEAMSRSEKSRFGRSALNLLAGSLWIQLHKPERSHAAYLAATSADPLNLMAWYQLVYTAGETGSGDAIRLLASTWFPQEASFLQYLSGTRSDLLTERLRDCELAYWLEPTLSRTMAFGRVLAEAGRAEEVRALMAATPQDKDGPDPLTASSLLGYIDMHDAMFERAIGHLEEGAVAGAEEVPIIAAALGRTEETSSKWASTYIASPPARATELAKHSPAPIALCMGAKGALAEGCLARVASATGEGFRRWGVGGDKFLAGAKRYASGDLRGAINEWRPLVGSSNDRLIRLLPTATFDRLGEHDLAARIDERKLHYRQLAGVSEATPREAHRAFEHGDRARAKELAQSVVHAWEVADTVIPAVADMKALLAKIGD